MTEPAHNILKKISPTTSFFKNFKMDRCGKNMNADQLKLLRAKHHAAEGVKAGFKAAAVAGIATAIPTLMGARAIPWARANLNYAAQALIISTVSGSAYFVAADKAILKSAREHSFSQLHSQADVQSPFV